MKVTNKGLWRRLAALLLALSLGAPACAQERQTVGIAATFSAAPSSDRMLSGLAETLNMLNLYGVLDTQGRDYLFSGGARLA